MPVSRMKGCEGPLYAFHRKAVVNRAVVRYVEFVIVDKIERLDWPVKDQRHCRQQEGDQQSLAKAFTFHS